MNRSSKSARAWMIWTLFMVLCCLSTAVLEGVWTGKFYESPTTAGSAPSEPRRETPLRSAAPAPVTASMEKPAAAKAAPGAAPHKPVAAAPVKSGAAAKTAAARAAAARAARRRRLVIEWKDSHGVSKSSGTAVPENSRLVIEWKSSSGTAKAPQPE